jgi:hypothetical protein
MTEALPLTRYADGVGAVCGGCGVEYRTAAFVDPTDEILAAGWRLTEVGAPTRFVEGDQPAGRIGLRCPVCLERQALMIEGKVPEEDPRPTFERVQTQRPQPVRAVSSAKSGAPRPRLNKRMV